MENRFKIARNHHRGMKMNRGICYSQWQSVKENFNKLDQFGHPITLTYKGRDQFQTPWGAFVSMCVCLVMTWVLAIMISQIYTLPFQSRSVVKELVNPNADSIDRLVVPNPTELLSFVNLDSLAEDKVQVDLSQTFYHASKQSKDTIFNMTACDETTGNCKLSTEDLGVFNLFESQKVAAYDTVSDKYEGSDFVQLTFSPCFRD